MRKFTFQVELHSLWNRPVRVTMVRLEGLRIAVPPKGANAPQAKSQTPAAPNGTPSVIIDTIIADGARLSILRKDPQKDPLDFDIRTLKLSSAGLGIAMRYAAELTNPKPPGLIRCHGGFGPWVSENPSDTPLNGEYVFENADLGVFKGIAGRLDSTGMFGAHARQDRCRRRDAHAGLPAYDKRKHRAASDHVPRHHRRRQWQHAVAARRGHAGPEQKFVRCAEEWSAAQAKAARRSRWMSVFKEGYIGGPHAIGNEGPQADDARSHRSQSEGCNGRPERVKIADKLRLSGSFALRQSQFTSRTVQDKIDEFSSRAQGKPGDKGGG